MKLISKMAWIPDGTEYLKNVRIWELVQQLKYMPPSKVWRSVLNGWSSCKTWLARRSAWNLIMEDRNRELSEHLPFYQNNQTLNSVRDHISIQKTENNWGKHPVPSLNLHIHMHTHACAPAYIHTHICMHTHYTYIYTEKSKRW